MILLETLRRRHLRAALPSISYDSSDFLFFSSISRRHFSLAALFANIPDEKPTQQRSEPLSAFYKGAVGINERIEDTGIEAEINGGKNAILKEKLKKLEEQVRVLKKNRGETEKGKSLKPLSEKRDSVVGKEPSGVLVALFTDKKTKKPKPLKPIDFGNEDPMVHKELSSDMRVLACHLYKNKYLLDASFMPKGKLDLTCFETSFARDFLKFAAVKFGKDHQEIAKWLSASDLKNVALFGCPSLGQKTVRAAKHMREFFGIEENKVCQKCPLRSSCKHANAKSKKDSTNLNLACVTRVLVMYAMESVPQQLVVPEEVNTSVSRLLNEIVNLSQTVPLLCRL
ncbi:hypothetical protein ABFS82_13G065200 [Erythranthe guttata]|uniref:Uncharacterized protein n=1 Tax=Erythranthe guttata TaxID=4155 RepID=A0A022QPM8_ERYGU|nr:PREDICTED: uncharacterized protein LOC105966771 [Erythranthe guttata]EYU29528.1 hypothetical protein MIMGU_mgv1a009470mg [Erythranthe guttata]EYU29529.1 hypothetical protein MIMGU_mgv1a009470mg [Erythranthe guttata]|eukprot:XP_012846809.1 PREDICTED: uncharacterized protein LOC105966771 [Erythranthe guttata]